MELWQQFPKHILYQDIPASLSQYPSKTDTFILVTDTIYKLARAVSTINILIHALCHGKGCTNPGKYWKMGWSGQDTNTKTENLETEILFERRASGTQRWTILSTIDHYCSKILPSLLIILTSEKPIIIDSRKTCKKESKLAKWIKKCNADFLLPFLSIHMP